MRVEGRKVKERERRRRANKGNIESTEVGKQVFVRKTVEGEIPSGRGLGKGIVKKGVKGGKVILSSPFLVVSQRFPLLHPLFFP